MPVTFEAMPQLLQDLIDKVEALRVSFDAKVTQDKPETPGFISRAQVCELLHITPQTLHQWVRQGKIVSYKIGTRTLFKPSEVTAAVKAVEVAVGKKNRR